MSTCQAEVVVLPAPDDEVGTDSLDVVESPEVVVATVKDVEGVFLVRYRIHRIHVMYLCLGDVEECRYGSLDVI